MLPLTVESFSEFNRRQLSAVPPTQLFHYTSLESARSIIETKSLRLTKMSYLNDRSELNHALDLVQKHLEEARGIVTTGIRAAFIEEAQSLLARMEDHICVVSFCEDGDLLSQWGMYANGGRGVALGFRSAELTDVVKRLPRQTWLLKCVYDPHLQELIVIELIHWLLREFDGVLEQHDTESVQETLGRQIIQEFVDTLAWVAPALKNGHFNAEREWRLVWRPVRKAELRTFVSNQRTTVFHRLDFHARNERYHFLHDIHVGPQPEAWLVAEAIDLLCDNENISLRGFVKYSNIPLRI